MVPFLLEGAGGLHNSAPLCQTSVVLPKGGLDGGKISRYLRDPDQYPRNPVSQSWFRAHPTLRWKSDAPCRPQWILSFLWILYGSARSAGWFYTGRKGKYLNVCVCVWGGRGGGEKNSNCRSNEILAAVMAVLLFESSNTANIISPRSRFTLSVLPVSRIKLLPRPQTSHITIL